MELTGMFGAKSLKSSAFALCVMGLTGATIQPAFADSDSCGLNNFDGFCDDGRPGADFDLCSIGTDFSDCGPAPVGLLNPCPFTNDNQCDEPDGLNLCAFGTDVNDCNSASSSFGSNPNPNAPVAGGGGISTPIASAPRAPAIPSTQQGVQIQTALNYFGFNAGGVDGQIGAGTRAAISRFQGFVGVPATGTMPADQLGLLLGAYTWATTQGGAIQTGQSGFALLSAYRQQLAGPLAPASVAPIAAVPTPAPQVAAPVPAAPVRPQGTSGPTTGFGSFAGLAGGGNTACPTPQNSEGFTLIFNGYSTEVFPGNDQGTDSWTTADDGSFRFEVGTNPLGMRLFGWDMANNGDIVPGTDYDFVYNGSPIPNAAVGAYWEGTDEARFNETVAPATPVRSQIFDEISITIGACTYDVYRGAVSRPTPSNPLETNRYFLYFPMFGLNVFVGEALSGTEPVADQPIDIRIR